MSGQDAAVGWLTGLELRVEHDRPSAIAEQNASASIVPVENPREGLGTDYERALERAGAQEIIGSGQGEYKPRAHGLQIERRTVVDAEIVLHGNRGRRKGMVRGRGRKHDQIDRLRVDAGIGQRRARGMDGQMRGELAVGRDMALPDPGTLYDPLVGGIYPRRQFGVGQNLLRQIRAAAEHHGTYCSHETASCAAGAFASAPPSRLSILLILARRSLRTVS